MTEAQKQQITEMRKNGKTYADISESLNLPAGTVKSFCSRNALHPEILSDMPAEIQESVISETGCKCCGKPLINTHGHRQKTFCSLSCRKKYWQEHKNLMQHPSLVTLTCPECGDIFADYPSHHRKYCSHACYIISRYRKGNADAAE